MTLYLPKTTITWPSGLREHGNGQLPGGALRRTLAGDWLHHRAADAWDAMHALAGRHGIDLAMTDGYRPYADQERIFRERYKTLYRPFTDRKVWLGRTWYRWSGATAAAPGTSNHGWGVAVDVNTNGLGNQTSPGVKLRWLAEYAESFGWSWELLPSEPWHIRYVAGDNVPQRVQAWLNNGGAPAPAPAAPAAPLDLLEDDMPVLIKPEGRDGWYLTDFATYLRGVPGGPHVEQMTGALSFIGAWNVNKSTGGPYVVPDVWVSHLPGW